MPSDPVLPSGASRGMSPIPSKLRCTQSLPKPPRDPAAAPVNRTLGEFLAEQTRRGGLIAKLLIGFLDADGRTGSRREAAIGIEHDAFRGQEFQGAAHAAGNGGGIVNLPGCDADAAEPDLEILAKSPKYCKIARAGRRAVHC